MTKRNIAREKKNAKYTYKEYYDMGLRMVREDAEYVNKSKNKNLIRFKGDEY